MVSKIDKGEPVTRGMLDEAIKAIFKGMRIIINGSKKELENKVDEGFEEAKYERKQLKNQIDELEYNTPTRKIFWELKVKVNHCYPSN